MLQDYRCISRESFSQPLTRSLPTVTYFAHVSLDLSVGRFELGEWNHISACVLSVVKHWAVDGAMTAIEAAVLRGAGATSVSSALRVSLFISVIIIFCANPADKFDSLPLIYFYLKQRCTDC